MSRSATQQKLTQILWLSMLTVQIAAPKTIFQFGMPNDGAYPSGGVVEKGGVLYGATSAGGTAGLGAIYSLAPAAGGGWIETLIWSFAGGRDGANPTGNLIADAHGSLYGVTVKGGTNGNGTIFALSPPASSGGAWRKSVLYSFTAGAGGESRSSYLAIGSGGVLYGTTAEGGTANDGTVFSLTPPASGHAAWTLEVIYNFTDGSDGAIPLGGLAVGSDGTLYGVTANGGDGSCQSGSISGCGTVFALAPPASPGGPWTETTLYSFSAVGSSSPNPTGLVLGSGGVLYGIAARGGIGRGSVFSLNPPASPGGSWTETDLYLFQGKADGSEPTGTLAIGAEGVLYGIIAEATERSYQGVFSVTPPASPGGAWTESVVYTADAFGNLGDVTIGGKGTVYTTGDFLQEEGYGSVISLEPPKLPTGSWKAVTLHTFSGGAAGDHPIGGVVTGRNGGLYGLTRKGGTSDAGAAYSLSAPGRGAGEPAILLHSFGSGSDGANPAGSLLAVAEKHGQLFYGVTQAGGASGFGTVFELTRPQGKHSSWSESVIYSFAGGSDGANPAAGLISHKGALFGTTQSGGADGYGTVFSLTPPAAPGGPWTKATVYSFTGSDGANPMAELLEYRGKIYGTTYAGGTSNNGTAFSLTPPAVSGGPWTETVLYSFAGGSDGANPGEKLKEWHTVLYGTTVNGGPAGAGTVYALTPMGGFLTWAESVIYAFKGTKDGAHPLTQLVAAKIGKGHDTGLLGTATEGGKSGGGTLFSLTLPAGETGAWTQAVLLDFDNDSAPSGALVWSAGKDYGEIYGTASSGGTAGGGTVFEKGIGFE